MTTSERVEDQIDMIEAMATQCVLSLSLQWLLLLLLL